jgi:hypothetical protein
MPARASATPAARRAGILATPNEAAARLAQKIVAKCLAISASDARGGERTRSPLVVSSPADSLGDAGFHPA